MKTVRGFQISSVFCLLLARIFQDLEREGQVEIIPVKKFPKGAPLLDEQRRMAYFAVRCAKRAMREAMRRRAEGLARRRRPLSRALREATCGRAEGDAA